MLRKILVLLFLITAGGALADAPAGYYDVVDLNSQATCRVTLHNLIDDHVRYPYTSSSTDTWDILEYADEDPLNSANILDLYKNHSYLKFGGGTGPYNREHSWPNSYGFSSSGDTPYTDCHHLFLCDVSYNGSRGNLYFDDCLSGCTSYPADTYNGESGVNLRDANSWETWQGRKGDVARAMFYLDVRYEGDSGEVDLVLTDNPAQIVVTDGAVAYMGLISTLLEWHQDDPVDAKEMRRNDRVYSYQTNRNPFVDHPEWVDFLFGSGVISGAGETAPALAAAIDRIAPNPFNPATVVEYSVNQPGTISVRLYDLAGRRVRTLADGDHAPGFYQVRWDGRDQTGRLLPSATYFCRLEGVGLAETRKITLLK